MLSANGFFKTQLEVVEGVVTENCSVMGDFKLDAQMDHNQDYTQKALLKILKIVTLAKNLMQIVDFTTWSRTVKGNLKQSLLDHVYVSNFAMVKNVDFEVPTFVDHILIKVKLPFKKIFYQNTDKIKRAWSKYLIEQVYKDLNDCNLLAITAQCCDAVVQEHWNVLKNVILKVIDSLAPIVTCEIGFTNRKSKIPQEISCKMNTRKSIIKKYKITRSSATLDKIRFLNKEIMTHFRVAKRDLIRLSKSKNGGADLWKAVRLAKDLNLDSILMDLKAGGIPIPLGSRAERSRSS